MQILFVDGKGVYDYPCPTAMYARFLRADSKGTFVNQVLKPYGEQGGRTVRSHPRPLS
jgi:hypothetical protein